mgnify:FL=1
MEIKKLKDLCIGKGEYGIAAPAEPFSESKYRYLRITDISDNGTLLSDDPKSVSCQGCEKCILQENDIVFARTGNSTGRAFFYEPKYGELVYAGFLIKFHLDDTKVNPKYMKYYTISQTYRNWVNNGPTGSTRGNMSEGDFADMPVFLPSRKQQDAIVNLFSPFDEKIDNNNAIAAELEGMAKDLYDYWFVQFDFPDENGKPYKSSGGKMVWNEELKREIPEGWENGIVSDLGTVVTGGTPSTGCAEYFAKSKSGHAWATPKDLSNLNGRYFYHGEADITDAGLKNSAGNIMPKGSVLFTTRAPIGYIAITANEACTNQGFKSIIPAEKFGTEFVFQTLKMLTPQMQRVGVGSTFKEVSKDVFSHQSIVIPSVNLLKKYAALTLDIAEKIRNTQEENVELTSLRDVLLPMLMNGQVKVKGA